MQKVASSTVLSSTLLPKDKTRKAYVLISKLDPELRAIAINYKDKRLYVVLICTILCLIRLSGGVLLRDQLYSYLERLGFNSSGESCEPYGSIESILSLFVRQAYLDRTKITSQDTGQDIYRYKWGPRSKSEFQDEGVITFVKRTYNFQDEAHNARLETELRRIISAEFTS